MIHQADSCRLVGHSPAFREMLEKLPLLARCDASVLISGETGTGKEVCSRAIHDLGPRAMAPFVPVNCGAIPSELVENELFGHEREAFTGAANARPGLIREAEGGTLFLDEIDGLPLASQVKLLRFLQEMEYRPLGSTRARTADVRVIAATNADAEEAVASGRLREDLFYRLSVLPLELPPLRDRPEDNPLLARHFLERQARKLGVGKPKLSGPALEKLLHHPWPGNVRELEHTIERALLLGRNRATLELEDIQLRRDHNPAPRTFREAKARIVARFERAYVEKMLLAHHGNISRAARASGKNRRAFFELVRKHEIDADRYREELP